MAYSLEELKKKNKEGLVRRDGSSNRSLATKPSLGIKKTDLESRLNSLSKKILPEAAKVLKESKLELLFIFDKSSSCAGTEAATIAGYNELIEKEKNTGLPTKVTLVLFSDRDKEEVIVDRADIKNVPKLSYRADGWTALYDTLCNQIKRIKKAQEINNETSTKTIVVIMTDGEDTGKLDYGSALYDENDTRNIITERRKAGWEFIFLGANQDAKKVAAMLGINELNAETYIGDSQGVYLNFHAVRKAIESYRQEGTINQDWSKINKQNNLALGSGTDLDNDGPTLRLGGRK